MKDVLQPPESFKSLVIQRKDVVQEEQTQYRVFTSAKEFVQVTAENAQDALQISGVKDAVRVLRYLVTQCNVLEFPVVPVGEKPVGEKPVAEAPKVEEVAAPAEEAAADAPAQDAALSNEEVEKLLQDKS